MISSLVNHARVRALASAALLALIPLTAGCPLSPLASDIEGNDDPTDSVYGSWIVTHVDGAPLPPAGFVLEPGILARNLFVTFAEPGHGTSTFVATYQIVRNGAGEPPKKVAGKYVYWYNIDDFVGELHLIAYNKTFNGSVSGRDMDADNLIVYRDRNGTEVRRNVKLKLRR